MLSPGSFAAVQVDFLCTSEMSPELPSPQTFPCGPRVSLWAYRKEIHQNLKITQNRSSLGFFFWLSLSIPRPPLFFFFNKKTLLPAKTFPSLAQLPHNLAALSFSSFILRFFWIWLDGKAPLHQRFDTAWKWTPAAGHSFTGQNQPLLGVLLNPLLLNALMDAFTSSGEIIPKHDIQKEKWCFKTLSPVPASRPCSLFQLYRKNIFLLETERKLWKKTPYFCYQSLSRHRPNWR